MADWEIWHNPRCSKSRQALQLLEDNGIEPNVILYLKSPPSTERLNEVLGWLRMEPQDLIRTKEKLYKELELVGASLSKDEWIQTMVENPKLIERPVVIHKGQAAVGRPMENILRLLD